jgi:uncharacterized SAM-binding protein YcdF (DUF218 family)
MHGGEGSLPRLNAVRASHLLSVTSQSAMQRAGLELKMTGGQYTE